MTLLDSLSELLGDCCTCDRNDMAPYLEGTPEGNAREDDVVSGSISRNAALFWTRRARCSGGPGAGAEGVASSTSSRFPRGGGAGRAPETSAEGTGAAAT